MSARPEPPHHPQKKKKLGMALPAAALLGGYRAGW